MGAGILFTLATAIVAALYAGVGAFFDYLAVQVFVCIFLPAFA
jgi:hypothetical protein